MNLNHKIGHDAELTETVRFHGHLCPGLAIGYRASKIALERLASERAEDEEMVAIVENDSCSVDAVQWLTGCTFGKGNFIFRDFGKQVFTFAMRPTGRAVRIALKACTSDVETDRETRINHILNAPTEDLFEVMQMTISLPPMAQIRDSVVCESCGEGVMNSRAVERDGQTLCTPCSQEQEK